MGGQGWLEPSPIWRETMGRRNTFRIGVAILLVLAGGVATADGAACKFEETKMWTVSESGDTAVGHPGVDEVIRVSDDQQHWMIWDRDRIIIDGNESPKYIDVDVDSLYMSPEGKHHAYIARKGKK